MKTLLGNIYLNKEEKAVLAVLRKKSKHPWSTGARVGGHSTGLYWIKRKGPLKTKCWVWISCKTKMDYGGALPFASDKKTKAHRCIYEIVKGKIPKGLHLDHLCRIRACVNPNHLEPVTPRENNLRGIGMGAIHSRKTHCLRGHLFKPDNLVNTSRKERRCKKCSRIHNRNQKWKILNK